MDLLLEPPAAARLGALQRGLVLTAAGRASAVVTAAAARRVDWGQGAAAQLVHDCNKEGSGPSRARTGQEWAPRQGCDSSGQTTLHQELSRREL